MARRTVAIPAGTRAQSNVVGVAILIGITMLSLGALTAAVGTVVESNAAAVDADRVAADLDAAVQPVETTGPHAGRVSFTDGELRTVDRTIRVHDGDDREVGLPAGARATALRHRFTSLTTSTASPSPDSSGSATTTVRAPLRHVPSTRSTRSGSERGTDPSTAGWG